MKNLARCLGALLVIPCVAAGCYYAQAVQGHLGVMSKQEPIAELVESADTPGRLLQRLELVGQARQFSVEALGLPDNDSYTSYADLERDYVVWNVIAAPEFSTRPKRWCYPISGCVSYRGYFAEEKARNKGRRLAAQGYDVVVGGVAAYSSLGRFDDPILNTMMHWQDADLVAVMFHELAHQLLYVKGDSTFNESFATAVEEFGLERWLRERGAEQALSDYRARRALSGQVMHAIDRARTDLEGIYAAHSAVPEKRSLKQERLARMKAEIRRLASEMDLPAPTWLEAEINNARLASLTLYEGRLPEFRRMLERCSDQLSCFYAEAQALAELDQTERNRRLDAL